MPSQAELARRTGIERKWWRPMSIEVYLGDMEQYLSKLDYQRSLAYQKICEEVEKERSQGLEPPKSYQEIRKRVDEQDMPQPVYQRLVTTLNSGAWPLEVANALEQAAQR
jgi:hypothetical protein